MATTTLGTSLTTSLTSLKFLPGYGSGMSAADIATISNAIRTQSAVQNREPGAFGANGELFLPGKKGVIKLEPGDYVAVDPATGWPIVVSAYAIANGGNWTHT